MKLKSNSTKSKVLLRSRFNQDIAQRIGQIEARFSSAKNSAST